MKHCAARSRHAQRGCRQPPPSPPTTSAAAPITSPNHHPSPPAAAAPAAADARLLRQYTDSFTGAGVDSSQFVLAATDTGMAEARSAAVAPGFAHMEPLIASLAAYILPGPQSKATTQDTSLTSPGISMTTGENAGAAFGTVAGAATDQGAFAVAASTAMPLAAPRGTPGTSRGSTLKTFDPTDVRGAGKSHAVMVKSIGMNLLPAGSFANSDRGDGPYAISSAGQAVASAYSSRFDVTNPTNGKLPWRRRRRR